MKSPCVKICKLIDSVCIGRHRTSEQITMWSKYTDKEREEITKEKEAELFDQIKSRYDQQISPYYSAARIWTDAVINPLDTRTWISMGIEAANHAPIEKQFNMGVLQV